MNWVITYQNFKLSRYNLKQKKSMKLTDIRKLEPEKGMIDPPKLDLSVSTLNIPKPPKTPCIKRRPKKKTKASMDLYIISE